MGEYLKMYNSIKQLIYEKDFKLAKERLKNLLNCLNQDMLNAKDTNEKAKAKKAIVKLLPALEELKKETITDKLINIFSLDKEKIENIDKVNIKNDIEDNNKIKEKNKNDEILKKEINNNGNENQEKITPIKPIEKKPLSPKTLDDYIGQEKVKQAIRVSIKAAKTENRVLEHLLICSPYGLGKTTLAQIIANEMQLPFFSVNATNIKDTKALSLYFSKIKESCIIFIDEIHSLKNDVQTLLLSILSDYYVSFIDDKGNEKKFNLPPFTLIGATTQAGQLLKPFLNRFTMLELTDYTDEEKDIIVKSKFDKLGYEIEDDAVRDISCRSRGIPRTIETFAKGIRDIAIGKETKLINLDIVNDYFNIIEIDELGLGSYDLKILNALASSDHPLALITIESKTGIQKEDLEFRYEPYLIKIGFIEKTERGRIITEKGLNYLKTKNSDNE